MINRKRTTKYALISSVIAVLASQGIADTELDALIAAGSYDDAIAYVNGTLTNVQARTVEEWMQLAQAYIAVDNEPKALATYRLAGLMHRDNGLSFAGTAAIQYDQGNYDAAETNAKKGFELTPNAETAWQYARVAIELGKPVEAKAALEEVIATDPTNVQANSSLGQIYFDEAEYAKASSLLEIAYQNGASQELAYKVALSYKESSNSVKAKEFYDLAVSGNSKLYNAMIELADISFVEANYSRAYTEYGRGKNDVTLSAMQQYNYAVAAEKESKSDAIDLYREAITLFGSDTRDEALAARLIVADTDYESEFASDAIENYSFYLDTKGGEEASAKIWYKLAEMQVATETKEDAVVSLEKSIALDASLVASYALLADIYSQLGEGDKSEATLEGLIAQNQTDPSVYLKLGDYKFSKAEFEVALTNYETSHSLDQSDAAARGVALSAGKLSQWTKVVPAAKQVLTSGADLPVQKVYAKALVETLANTEALPEVKKVLAAEPSNTEYWKLQYRVGEALVDNITTLEADSALITLESDNIDSRTRYSAHLIAQDKKADAFPIVVELTVLESSNANHYKTGAELAEALNDTVEATTLFEGYLALEPAELREIIKLGELYFAADRTDDALAMYRKALELSDQPAGFPYEHYADIVIKKGETEEVITALTGLVETGAADAGTYTTLGMLYKNSEQYTKAIEMYEQAIILEPTNLTSSIAIGNCQLEVSDFSGAIISFETASMMNADSTDVYERLGYAYEKNGDSQLSIANYRTYIEKGGSQSDVAMAVGADAFAQEEFDLAAKAYLMVDGDDANDFTRQQNLAISLFNTEQYEPAIEWSKKVIARGPRTITRQQLMKNVATSYEILEQPAKALEVYDDYVGAENGWSDADVEFKRASMREESDLEQAKTIYLQNTTKYPNDMRSFLELGLILSNSEDPSDLENSANLLETVLSNAGESDPELLLTVAEAYGKAYLYEKELEAYKKYCEVNPEDVDAYIRIGQLQMETGVYEEAVINFEIASALRANDAQILFYVGQAYSYQQSWTSAITNLEASQQIDPSNSETLKLLVDSYTGSGQKEKAKSTLAGLVEEGDPIYLMMYAEFLIEDGNTDEANDIADGMIEIYEADPDAQLLKGKILRAMGDNATAIQHFQYSARLNTYSAEAQYELGQTYEMMGGASNRRALMAYDKALRIDEMHGNAWYRKAILSKLFKQNDIYVEAITQALELLPNNQEVRAEALSAGVIH